MKAFALLIFCFTTLCVAQTDPRVMANRYEPVSLRAIFQDTFIAAYNSGNRAYIESMVLQEAVPEHFRGKSNPINVLLPPYFNTHEVITSIYEREDGISLRLKQYPDSFSHLPVGVVPVAILEFTIPFILKDGTEVPTTYGFLIVKQGDELFIGVFNDKHISPLAK